MQLRSTLSTGTKAWRVVLRSDARSLPVSWTKEVTRAAAFCLRQVPSPLPCSIFSPFNAFAVERRHRPTRRLLPQGFLKPGRKSCDACAHAGCRARQTDLNAGPAMPYGPARFDDHSATRFSPGALRCPWPPRPQEPITPRDRRAGKVPCPPTRKAPFLASCAASQEIRGQL